MSINLSEQISPHFKLGEFACHCGGKLPGCKLVIRDAAIALAHRLETLRLKFYPHGLSIIDSYRCPEHNGGTAGSALDSQHLYGKAADIAATVPHASVIGIHLFTGIGWNSSNGNVSHVDIRPGDSLHPATWTYAR